MKELKPLTIKRFKCDFCNKITRTQKGMEGHEYRCYKNPNRDCDTCSNEGIELYDTLGDNLGVIPDGGERECPSCKIAETLGGKSYIQKLSPPTTTKI